MGGDDTQLINAWNKIGQYYSDRHKWSKAAQFYLQVTPLSFYHLGF